MPIFVEIVLCVCGMPRPAQKKHLYLSDSVTQVV